MLIKSRKLKDILKYDRNPRDNQDAIEPVLESLRLHGQVKPIVLSAKGYPFETETVCCGHTTLLALEKFGADKVNCVVHKFKTEKEFADYNIRDNKTSEYANWNEAEYNSLVAEFDLEFDVDSEGLDLPPDEPEDEIKQRCNECGQKLK